MTARVPSALRLLATVAALAGCADAAAQVAGLLYDPQPPANSAYVRVINASKQDVIGVAVDGRPRVVGLPAGEAGEYLVLPAGKRTLSVTIQGHSGVARSFPLEVVAGRALSVAFHDARSDAGPWLFEDRANTNKLKAVLAFYHLDGAGSAVDVQTADGSTRVFNGLKSGTSSAIVVNPVSIELVAKAAGSGAAIATAALSMQPGGTYSVLLLPHASGKPFARALQNKVERYTGR